MDTSHGVVNMRSHHVILAPQHLDLLLLGGDRIAQSCNVLFELLDVVGLALTMLDLRFPDLGTPQLSLVLGGLG